MFVSLAGSMSVLLATGGLTKTRNISECVSYSIAKHRWSSFPSLNLARHSSASCLMASKNMLSFSGKFRGLNWMHDWIGEVERINIVKESEWRVLPRIQEVENLSVSAFLSLLWTGDLTFAFFSFHGKIYSYSKKDGSIRLHSVFPIEHSLNHS